MPSLDAAVLRIVALLHSGRSDTSISISVREELISAREEMRHAALEECVDAWRHAAGEYALGVAECHKRILKLEIAK